MAAIATIFNVVTLIVATIACGGVFVVVDFWPIFTLKNQCTRQRSHRGSVAVDEGTK